LPRVGRELREVVGRENYAGSVWYLANKGIEALCAFLAARLYFNGIYLIAIAVNEINFCIALAPVKQRARLLGEFSTDRSFE
jgi:hypothetical protein